MYLHDKMVGMFAWQLIQSINMLEDGLDDEGWPRNCCPICCGPCSDLLAVLDNCCRLEELNTILADCGYIKSGGWTFWNDEKRELRVKKIKRFWFDEEGRHKAICLSVNGVNRSDEIHQALRIPRGGM